MHLTPSFFCNKVATENAFFSNLRPPRPPRKRTFEAASPLFFCGFRAVRPRTLPPPTAPQTPPRAPALPPVQFLYLVSSCTVRILRDGNPATAARAPTRPRAECERRAPSPRPSPPLSHNRLSYLQTAPSPPAARAGRGARPGAAARRDVTRRRTSPPRPERRLSKPHAAAPARERRAPHGTASACGPRLRVRKVRNDVDPR
jgi:hypothetical protein